MSRRLFSTGTLALIASVLGASIISISVSPVFAILAAAQIVGALLLRAMPAFGTVLLRIGAVILSLGVIPLGIGITVESPQVLIRNHDATIVFISVMWFLATLVQMWVDFRLVADYLKKRRMQDFAMRH